MLSFPVELVGEQIANEAAVYFTEALAKINARQFVREDADASPCCARCAGCRLDESTPLTDAKRLLELGCAAPVSIVAYSMGRALADGLACRAVLIDGSRLAYQFEDGAVVDPLSKFPTPSSEEPDDHENESCNCRQHRADGEPAA